MCSNKITYYLGILFLIFVSCSKETPTSEVENDPNSEGSSSTNFVANVTNSPLDIKGVKWRQHSEDEFLQPEGSLDWWLNKPVGTKKIDILTALQRNNVNSVVFRVDRASRFKAPSETNFFYAMDDIIDIIKKAKDNEYDVEFYLWGRIWMERDGNPNFGSVKKGAEKVKEWFTPILNKAKEIDVLENIKGIILVETNINSTADVKAYAKETLAVFNATQEWNDKNGNPFFTEKTFITSGAGFGLDFRNIGNDNGSFFADIKSECKNFAFLYKFMRATHETTTINDYSNVMVNGIKRTWDEMERNSNSFSVQDRKTFLNYFGAEELTTYIKDNKATYPNHANLVFWGDKWDGISKTPPLSRRAVHELFVETGNTGHFFSLASSTTSNSAAIKFYLLNGLQKNAVEGWSKIDVYSEWNNWNSKNTNY